MSDSTLYTIGTALNRAQANSMTVDILVEGVWLQGQIAAVDGHGVVLSSDSEEHAVIRVGSVSAVRIHAPAPQLASLEAGARPMQGPREGWDT